MQEIRRFWAEAFGSTQNWALLYRKACPEGVVERKRQDMS